MLFTTEQIQFIRRESKRCEQNKRLTERLHAFMTEHQLFKLIVPEEMGGKMLGLPSAVRIFQEASSIDGNFGWLVTVGSGGGMFTQNMTTQAAKSYYSPKNAVIAGSGFPAGTAEVREDGYIINGKWMYCSGSQYATLFTVSCRVKGETTEQDQILAFILDPDQVTVIEDWKAFGLKGTSSHSIEVVDQFVPNHRAFSIFENQNHLGGLVHTFPFVPFAEASFAAVSLGIGEHFLEEVGSLLEISKQNWQQGPVDRYKLLKRKLASEKQRLEKANQAFHNIVEESWDIHSNGSVLSEELIERFSTVAKRSASSAITCANNLFRHIGMQAVKEPNDLNQIWRDLYTASQHAFLIPVKDEDSRPF
ncbi:acyl-CoA dehydrogenase [Paraliobacillus quinghaiensis]|uniref:Acyl-CoA dehydrogenase n=1 Tax=Paraliobacillus quinghaiensis TaxID=470815 RepID=A0A917WV75_9BACI|nr:acyl-CoA dehydrogenase family protein [Paraliobacillus quinghaiensis]GGM31774.1 acyl-CoA dehydrogenase [Paraliobacillus quinghaiensis]